MTSPVSAAPTRPMGYAVSGGGWWAATSAEQTPELRWPRSVAVYDRMRVSDAQVASVLRAVTLPVRRTPWRIDAAGARPEVVELISQDLGLPVKGQEPSTARRPRDRFSWPEHLRLALLSLVHGHAFFEQQYRIDDSGPAPRARLRKLAPRPARTISAINVAADGGLESIEQHPPVNVSALEQTRWILDREPIPVSRLVAYVHDPDPGVWTGSSLLRSAYKDWIIKDRLLRVGAQSVERNGMGLPIYEAGEGESSLDKGLEIATNARAGDNSGVALPKGAKFRLAGVEGTLPDALAWVRYHDEQIARAVLAHVLNLGQASGTGSYALGVTLLDIFTQGLQTVADFLRDVAQQHVIEDLVDLNFGEGEPTPVLECDEIGEQVSAQAIKLLLDSGALFADRDLEEFLRQALKLPPKAPRTPPPGDTE